MKEKALKRILLPICLALSIIGISTRADAWAYCVKDPLYGSAAHLMRFDFDPATGVINGGAYSLADSSWQGAITGALKDLIVSIAIAYKGDLGVRFYEINLASITGRSWGVYGSDGTFYDQPRTATLVGC